MSIIHWGFSIFLILTIALQPSSVAAKNTLRLLEHEPRTLKAEQVEERITILPTAKDIAQTHAQVQASICDTIEDVSPTECEALVALYKSTNGPTWTNHTNWLTDTAVDNWYGVTVSAGHVTRLDLTNNNMAGNIPPELGNLPNLTLLFMGANKLTGSIPLELSKLSSLTGLYLN